MSIWIELHLIIIIIILRQIIELIVPFFEIILYDFISILLRIAYRIEYRTEIRVKTRTIKTCCKGYAESSDHCIRKSNIFVIIIICLN
jgi:hypothetical protein